MESPYDLAFDRHGHVLVADNSGNYVFRFRPEIYSPDCTEVDAEQDIVITFGKQVEDELFLSPAHIAVSSKGIVYVAISSKRYNIQWFTPEYGDYLGVYEFEGGTVPDLQGLAVDNKDRLLVCDGGNQCVWVL